MKVSGAFPLRSPQLVDLRFRRMRPVRPRALVSKSRYNQNPAGAVHGVLESFTGLDDPLCPVESGCL